MSNTRKNSLLGTTLNNKFNLSQNTGKTPNTLWNKGPYKAELSTSPNPVTPTAKAFMKHKKDMIQTKIGYPKNPKKIALWSKILDV